jgi:two-component system, NtrC family, response regulator HydG
MSEPSPPTGDQTIPTPPPQAPLAPARTSLGGHVLVVDDQRNMRATTAMLLRQAGHAVEEAEDGAAAVQRLQAISFDVVVTDLRMPNVDGLEVLRAARELAPETEVIVMTAYATVEAAVEAMKRGAYDFVPKPFKEDELLLRVGRALERRRMKGELSLFAGEFRRRFGADHIVGASAAMRHVLERVVRVGPTDATVLVTGESGTGKEVVARALHVTSRRGDKPFVPVNCAAITETLLESELFGHARGAFTGAIRARRGLFEEAHGGTLFIDEIGETSPGFQAKLLRALQDGEIRRVGESSPVQVDVRVIAATNQDLRRAIAEKRFREDLFYRLNVVPMRLPPLRERREDVPLLVRHFLARYQSRTNVEKTLSAEAMQKLVDHHWPGNVRELENVVEQIAALSAGTEIQAAEVALDEGGPLALPVEPASEGEPRTLAAAVEEAERRAIEASLARCQGDLGAVARDLGVSPTTLWRKMKRLGVASRAGSA